MAGGILCLGNIVYDILVRPVDKIQWGATVWIDDIVRHIGGNGANTAYAAAMLSAVPVKLLAMVGADPSGADLLAILQAAGVDVSRVVRSETPTATTVGLVQSGGARAFLHKPGASAEAFAEPVDFSDASFEECSHFHLANPFALPRVRARASEILRGARAAGLRTSLDTGWDSRGEWLAVVGPCLPHVDILFANEDEGRILTGETEPELMAGFFHARGAQIVVLKLGARGCAVFSKEGIFYDPAFHVDAVDTTGAGDCFVGGFLAGMMRGESLAGSASLANAAGALSVRKLGSVLGLRDFEATRQWMEVTGRALPGSGEPVSRA